MLYNVFDLEIVKAIPPISGKRLPDIKYCKGWRDFEYMGIACWAMCILDDQDWSISDPISGTDVKQVEFQWYGFCHGTLAKTGGFNSRNFDDKLLQANGLDLDSDFDILEMVLEAAGLKDTAYWEMEPKRSYSLATIAAANGYQKTLSGEQAPIEWQRGNKQLVLDYCENDVLIEAETLKRLLQGTLIDPNTGERLLASSQEKI